jgi:site-specific recombinase XerD
MATDAPTTVPDHPMDQARRAVILDELADYLEPFLGWLRPVRGRSPHTIDVYRKDLRQFLAFVGTVDRRRPGMSTIALLHSFATRLRSQGADLEYVEQLLGHSSIQTNTIYSHYSHLVSVQQPDELARYLEEG